MNVGQRVMVRWSAHRLDVQGKAIEVWNRQEGTVATLSTDPQYVWVIFDNMENEGPLYCQVPSLKIIQ